MKQIIITVGIFLLSLSVQSCTQRNDKKQQPETTTIMMSDSLPQYAKEQQTSYIVHMNTKTPYELYLDDILIARQKEGGFSESIELNPYLLQNGIHTLKIRFLPNTYSEDSLVHPLDIVYDKDVKWNMYFLELKKDASSALGYSESIDYEKSELPIVAPPTDVPFWEQEFEVAVENLPYDLKGWRDGEDLSEWDRDELETEVVAFYNKLRSLLHEGNITEFMELNETLDFETAIAMYNTPEAYTSNYNVNVDLLTKKCAGNMLPIDNYVMKLYANGKVVALEIPEGKYKYWSALMSDSKKYGKSGWGIIIYKPRGSKDFVAIRK